MATGANIAKLEADIANLVPYDDDFIFGEKTLLPKEKKSEDHEWDIEAIYNAIETLRKDTEPSTEPSLLSSDSHPALQSMKEPLDVKLQTKIKQDGPVPPKVVKSLGEAHKMAQDMTATANERYQSRMRQFDALLKPTLAPNVHPESMAAAIQNKYPDNNAVIQKAIYVRKQIEQDLEEEINGALEEGQILRPSKHQWPELKPWMIKFLESHYAKWGPANDREIYILTMLFQLPIDTPIKKWTENKKETMRIWQVEELKKKNFEEQKSTFKELSEKPYQHH